MKSYIERVINMNIQPYIERVKTALNSIPFEEVDKAAELIYEKTHYRDNKKTYTFGNGGSWALAQHLTADFTKLRLPCICLPSSVSELTMWANDWGYEDVFFASLSAANVQQGQIVIAISSSGNSPNIIKAVEHAKRYANTIIGLSGFEKENKLNQLADIKIHIPTEKGDYGVVEVVHDAVIHLLTEKLKYALHTL